MDKQLDKLVCPLGGLTWQDAITPQSFKEAGIVIDCDKITLKQNGIEIVFGEEDFSCYKYIEINGVKFKREEK